MRVGSSVMARYTTAAPSPSPSPSLVRVNEPGTKRIQPKEFPGDTSIWSVLCLGELYRRGALADRNIDPVCPILAFHTFGDMAPGTESTIYKCSTTYLDALLQALTSAGFNVTPLSRLQSFVITGDAAILPPRPIVITIDDGSQSVLKLFASARGET